jgi:hypothetical protein
MPFAEMLRTHCAQILQDVVDRLRGPRPPRHGVAFRAPGVALAPEQPELCFDADLDLDDDVDDVDDGAPDDVRVIDADFDDAPEVLGRAALRDDDDELARLPRPYRSDVMLDILLVRSGDTTYVACHVQPAQSRGIPVVRVIGMVAADEDV